MTVSAIVLWSPPDTFSFPDRTLQPVFDISWTAGTGPYDVLHEWDTAATFDTGNYMTDSNTGISVTTDRGVPPSNMGPAGTTWYYRVKIQDRGDDVDEVQQLYNGATSGTFTISFDGQGPTGDIAYNGLAVKAEGTLTMDTNPTDGDTMTVDTKTYTFKDTLGAVDGHVKIGATLAATQASLVAAFDLSGTPGTDYSSETTAHTTVDIASFSSDQAVLTAKTAGTAGNSIATTETFTAGTNVFDAATLGTTTTGLNDLETEMESLSNITNVSISGSGTSGDPWVITFLDPGGQNVAQITTDDTNLVGGTSTISTTTQGSTASDVTSSTWSVDWYDPDDQDRHLYLYANILPDWDAGGTENNDPESFDRHLYALASVNPNWTTGADGDPKEFDRFLYALALVDTTQPCPHIWTIAPTTVKEGQSIVIRGTGFGDTTGTYGGTVRVYASQDHGASYNNLSIVSWSDTEIVATVGAGVTSGWVSVVHLTTPSCSGSNFKQLTVVAVEPDSDAGWWVDAYNILNDTKKVLGIPATKASFTRMMNDVGNGLITVPAGWDRITEIIDPDVRADPFDAATTPVTSFLRIYIDGVFRYGFFAERISKPYDEDGLTVVDITGPGQESIMDWGRVYPQDWDSHPMYSPNWVWGSTDNYVLNPTFDDAFEDPVLENAGGEDGNDSDGFPIGWGTKGTVDAYYTVKDAANAYEGDYYIYVDPGGTHTGIEQTIPVTPGKEYIVTCKVKEPTAAGSRITLACSAEAGYTILGTNNFFFDNAVLAELDDVARNPAANGCPGGSSDGTWQTMTVNYKTGTEQTSMTIAIQADMHSGCGGSNLPFWVDAVTVTGWGLGLDPWVPYDVANHASNSFRLTSALTLGGSAYACDLNPTGQYAGIEQVVTANKNTKYTATIWAYKGSPAVDDTYDLAIRVNDEAETLLGKVSKVPTDSEWTQYQVVIETDDTIEDEDNLIFRFAYTGPNNPGHIYLEDASLVPGEPASYAGVIMRQLLDHAVNRTPAAMTLVDYTSFSDTLDSDGQPWTDTLAITITRGTSYLEVLDRLVALGYEWEVVPKSFYEGGGNDYQLRLYNSRADNPDSGIGVNWSADDNPPTIMPGSAVVGGRVTRSVGNKSSVLVEGDGGIWTQATRGTAYEGYASRREDYVQNTMVQDQTTLSKVAKARLLDQMGKDYGYSLSMVRTDDLRPLLHFGLGDTLRVNLPDIPAKDAGGSDIWYRVKAISCRLEGEGNDVDYFVDINRVVFENAAAETRALERIIAKGSTENISPGTGSVGGQGTGAIVVQQVGTPSTSSGVHQHKLTSTEITEKTVSGDVSGKLPGPITVKGLRGRTVSSTAPTKGQTFVWDDVLNAWVPGADWIEYTPTWTAASSAPSLGSGTLSGRYYQINKLVVMTLRLLAAGDTTFGSGEWYFSLPVTAAAATGEDLSPGLVWAYDNNVTTRLMGFCWLEDTSKIQISHDGATANWSSTVPITWAISDILTLSFTYRAA